ENRAFGMCVAFIGELIAKHKSFAVFFRKIIDFHSGKIEALSATNHHPYSIHLKFLIFFSFFIKGDEFFYSHTAFSTFYSNTKTNCIVKVHGLPQLPDMCQGAFTESDRY